MDRMESIRFTEVLKHTDYRHQGTEGCIEWTDEEDIQ